MIETAYKVMLWCGIAFLSVSILFCLLRGILGPNFTDRVISVNLISSKTIIMIAILSFLLEESGLVDIAMVYALISFVAVVVLSKCYLRPHHPNPANIGRPVSEEDAGDD
jgi:Multisubunit Na+/H+ antiporter, MnhF subunit